jgi:fermentation-respiration switch protein FrsA (DUF1100 family)
VANVVKPVLVIAGVIVLLVTLAWVFQRKLIYLPDTSSPGAAHESIPGAQDVMLSTSDGLELRAWLVPGPSETAILVAHGNGGYWADRAPLAKALREKGFTVLLFSYRGYGGNPGSPSEAGLAMDARAARAFLADRYNRIVYFGESLGAAVMTELATEFPPAALALRSPFSSLADTAAVHYPFLPVRTMLKDRFPVREHISRVRVPTVVIYGSADSLVPPEQSQAVAHAAGGPVTLVEITGADHNDANLVDGQQLIDAVWAIAKT